MSASEWWFTDDPAEFSAVAGDFLATDPIQFTVMTTVVDQAVVAGDRGPSMAHPYWFAALRGPGGRLVSAAMRSAPFAPHPLWLLPMPPGAGADLARVLVERGEVVPGEPFGVNGSLHASRECAEAIAAHGGRSVHEEMRSRLFRLDEVRWPPAPAGRLRPAGDADVELVVEWVSRFHADAAEQAGRTWEPGPLEFDEQWAGDRVARGLVTIVEDPHGTPVHVTAWNAPAYGVGRIGPVFTPAQHRGRGYAGWCVAHASAAVLAENAVPCLFADQANPASNKVYERIGYRAVADTVTLIVR